MKLAMMDTMSHGYGRIWGFVGEDTGYKDANGRSLLVGDVVLVKSTSGDGQEFQSTMQKGAKDSYCDGKYFVDCIEMQCVDGVCYGYSLEYVRTLVSGEQYEFGIVKEVE